jgi:hypothetical protein
VIFLACSISPERWRVYVVRHAKRAQPRRPCLYISTRGSEGQGATAAGDSTGTLTESGAHGIYGEVVGRWHQQELRRSRPHTVGETDSRRLRRSFARARDPVRDSGFGQTPTELCGMVALLYFVRQGKHPTTWAHKEMRRTQTPAKDPATHHEEGETPTGGAHVERGHA